MACYWSGIYREPEKWPRDPFGYTFLPRALDRMGRALHGGDWRGDECATVVAGRYLEPCPTDDAFDNDRPIEAAHRRSTTCRILLESGLIPSDTPLPLTRDHWDLAIRTVRAQNHAYIDAKSRLDAVVAHMGDLAQSGALKVAYRLKGGGKMLVMSRTLWSLDDYESRFAACGFDPGRPYSPVSSSSSPVWLFIDINDLARATTSVAVRNDVVPISLQAKGAPYTTGAAGRPTSKHLILAEMERRAAAGQLLHSLAAEARSLREWLAKTHPLAPPIGRAASENAIRTRFWALLASDSQRKA